MIEFFLFFALFFRDGFTPVPAQDFTILEQEDIQGTWVVKFWSVRGGNGKLSDSMETKITFLGNHCISRTKESDGTETVSEFNFTVNSNQRPFGIDCVPDLGIRAGKILKGIYKINQGSLEMCLSLDPEDPRPTEFAPGEDWEFVKMNRQKQLEEWPQNPLGPPILEIPGRPVGQGGQAIKPAIPPG